MKNSIKTFNFSVLQSKTCLCERVLDRAHDTERYIINYAFLPPGAALMISKRLPNDEPPYVGYTSTEIITCSDFNFLNDSGTGRRQDKIINYTAYLEDGESVTALIWVSKTPHIPLSSEQLIQLMDYSDYLNGLERGRLDDIYARNVEY